MIFSVRGVLAVFVVVLFSACTSNYKPIPEHMKIETDSSIAVTAGISQTFVRSKNSNYLLCTQAMADAAYDQGNGADISYAFINTSSDQISGQDDANEVEMAGRTPAVLMAREMFFRACEFSGNFHLTKQEALTLYHMTLQTIGNVWATEAKNTTVNIGDSVKDASLLTISDKGAESINSAASYSAPAWLASKASKQNDDSDGDSDDSDDGDSDDDDSDDD